MTSLADLKGFAAAAAAVAGLITTLAPLANRLKGVTILQFGQPGLLNALGEIGALISFLAVYSRLNSLHLFWPFEAFLVLFVILAVVLFALGLSYNNKARVSVFMVGALLYSGASASLALGVSIFAAEFVVFRRIHGTLSTAASMPAVNRFVYITDSNDLEIADSTTNSRGVYQFLVPKQSQVDKVQACLTSLNSGTFQRVAESDSSIDYNLKECQ